MKQQYKGKEKSNNKKRSKSNETVGKRNEITLE